VPALLPAGLEGDAFEEPGKTLDALTVPGAGDGDGDGDGDVAGNET
jgi:hypothetical protein